MDTLLYVYGPRGVTFSLSFHQFFKGAVVFGVDKGV